MEFPKMIYQGGVIGDDAVIVDNQTEQDAQKAHGYLPLGEHAKDEVDASDTPVQAPRRGRPPKASK